MATNAYHATTKRIISASASGFMARISSYIGIALCAASTMWMGTAHATLVGDSVTVGHYAPDSTTALQSSSFTVEAGTTDIYTFYNSYPFGYQVNVEANSILVDFDYLHDATGTWEDSTSISTFTGVPPCGLYGCSSYTETITVIPYSFNGLGVSGLNDSSGNALQGVTVDTNMAGWDSSRLSFGSDYVQFDWKGLSFTSNIWTDWTQTTLATPATYFNATLDFGQAPITAVPEPETYAMLLAGLGLLGFMGQRRKNLAG
ncbi:MAG: PEP-CTERM sorting domain-containing protein [Gallionella sp.]|nr:PEP-CTERM sorting domain-containing protein [Gallionella sp.]